MFSTVESKKVGLGVRTFETCSHIVIFRQGGPAHQHRGSRTVRGDHVWLNTCGVTTGPVDATTVALSVICISLQHLPVSSS